MAIKRNVTLELRGAGFEDLAPQLTAPLRAALEMTLEGKDLGREQGVLVAQARGPALVAVASLLAAVTKEIN